MKIPFSEHEWTYGRLLSDATVAVYDAKNAPEASIDALLSAPVLFMIPVMYDAVRSARWPIIGHEPLSGQLALPPEYAKQDALNKDRYSISVMGEERPATREECIRLERYAVWTAEQVEERIRDHYAGRQNRWVEMLKIR